MNIGVLGEREAQVYKQQQEAQALKAVKIGIYIPIDISYTAIEAFLVKYSILLKTFCLKNNITIPSGQMGMDPILGAILNSGKRFTWAVHVQIFNELIASNPGLSREIANPAASDPWLTGDILPAWLQRVNGTPAGGGGVSDPPLGGGGVSDPPLGGGGVSDPPLGGGGALPAPVSAQVSTFWQKYKAWILMAGLIGVTYYFTAGKPTPGRKTN